jgi:c-di-GMP-binding flagellar brake protein YcgR
MTQITRVDFAEFHIVTHSKIPPGHKYKFILHSDSGKIEFSSTLKKSYNTDAERGNKVSFALPECIHVVQRRRDPRIRLHNRYDFFAVVDTGMAKTIFSRLKIFQMAAAR